MRIVLIVFVVCVLVFKVFSQQPLELKLQQRGEVLVSLHAADLNKLPNQGSWSIDKVTNDRAVVYLNQEYYKKLIELNIPFVQEQIPSQKRYLKMAHSLNEMSNWDAYPDYDTYIAMMNQFAIDYPDLCSLDTIGYSEEGRLLLSVKISDNVSEDESEPELFYTSSMHGDELTGYVLMLRLIDYLLVNYNSSEIKMLVDGVEIFINPLANPDGTFAGGNSMVYDATRGNAKGVDLNRNFPDRIKGDNPNGAWQKETIAMMEYMDRRNFSLSMNFHGGAEVLNYPYDDTVYRGELHPDNDWFNTVCVNYVTEARKVDEFYMRDIESSGVTIGWSWYAVSGGRQDYVTHFLNGREITVELSEKLPDASKLPSFWDKNYVSLLAYAQEALYGLQGAVTNMNGLPVHAKIQVLNHDVDSSHVWTQKDGVYYRYLSSGTYSIKVSASGYKSQTYNNITIVDGETTVLDVQLEEGVGVNETERLTAKVYPNPSNGNFTVELPDNTISELKIYTLDGRHVWSSLGKLKGSASVHLPDLKKGVYVLTTKMGSEIAVQKLIIK